MIPPAALLACISRRPSKRICLTPCALPRKQSSVPTFSRIGASCSCNRSSIWVFHFPRKAKPTDILCQDVFQPFRQHHPRDTLPVQHARNAISVLIACLALAVVSFFSREVAGWVQASVVPLLNSSREKKLIGLIGGVVGFVAAKFLPS